MRAYPSKKFNKSFSKLSSKNQIKVYEKIGRFLDDPQDPSLRNHSLHGKWSSYYSIDITGNIRLIYRYEAKDRVILADIGSHSKLYS